MGLSPLQQTEETRAELVQPEVTPSKTYEFNFDTGEFTSQSVDEIYAVKQYIVKALATQRYRFLIYDEDYGSEIEDYVGGGVSENVLESDIPRIISEAIIYDERIDDVDDFIINVIGDKLFVEFTVTLVDGTTFTQEVTL